MFSTIDTDHFLNTSMAKQKPLGITNPDPVERVNCFFDCQRGFKEKEPGGCVEPNGRIIIPYPSEACRGWDTRRRMWNQICRFRCGVTLPSDISIRDVELPKAFGSDGPSPNLPNQ